MGWLLTSTITSLDMKNKPFLPFSDRLSMTVYFSLYLAGLKPTEHEPGDRRKDAAANIPWTAIFYRPSSRQELTDDKGEGERR